MIQRLRERWRPTPVSRVDFLGVGAPRCGTTWAYKTLREHPDVRFPWRGEGHFWDSEYTGLDPEAEKAAYLARFERPSRPDQKWGDITPAYSRLPVDVVKRIHECAPDARVFFSLRSPLEQYWSGTRRRYMLEHAEPASEKLEELMLKQLSKSKVTREGLFMTTIRIWRHVYGEEAVMVYLLDDAASDPVGIARRLCEHIGVSPEPAAKMVPPSRVNEAPEAPMPERAWQVGRDVFRPQVEELSKVLDRDLVQAWLETRA